MGVRDRNAGSAEGGFSFEDEWIPLMEALGNNYGQGDGQGIQFARPPPPQRSRIWADAWALSEKLPVPAGYAPTEAKCFLLNPRRRPWFVRISRMDG